MTVRKAVSLSHSIPWEAAVSILFFAAFTALAARVTIWLPFTPVPVTLQVMAVLLAGLVLGARGGAASQTAYLVAILAGAPLSASGIAGPAALLGPTGGYLLGFVPAAFVVGLLGERLGRLPAALGGVGLIYLCGTSWLAVYLGGDLGRAWLLGTAPFVLPDLGKALLAVATADGGRALLTRLAQQ
jgi:biotin transport system substrate-specific component